MGQRGGNMMTAKLVKKKPVVFMHRQIFQVSFTFVIRKDTMEVIESQGLSQYTLNFVNILSDLRSGAYDTE